MDISVQEFKERHNEKSQLFVIDVREEWEFEESKIEKTVNIPLHSLPGKAKDISTSKETEVIVYCRTGVRGNTAYTVMKQAGFENVRNLAGGIVAYME